MPSIVIGVFVYGIAVLPFKQFTALAGGLALGIMMIPIITRTTEELLRLVPATLREGALALGATRGRAVFTVVLPAALPGIITGIVLALARIAGETAPLLFTAFNNRYWSTEPHAADRVADRAGLHLRDLALRRLAPPGLGRRARAGDARDAVLAARAARDAPTGADARVELGQGRTMGRDLRLAVRALRQQPVVSIAVIGTFALAFSAVGVTWGAFDAVVLKAVPGPHPDCVVIFSFTSPLSPTFRSRLSLADAAAVKTRSHTLEQLAAYTPVGDVTIDGRRSVHAAHVAASAGFFETFGVVPERGRWFSASDPADGAVVLSDEVWQRAFDRDPEAIGQPIILNGRSYVVVGVAPAGFNVPDFADQVWTYRALPDDGSPLAWPGPVGDRPAAPGVTFAHVETELNDLIKNTDAFAVAESVVFSVRALRDQIVGPAGRSIAILGGAVSVLLLIVCVNVVSLLLARQVTRHREAVIRRALGASRLDLFREDGHSGSYAWRPRRGGRAGAGDLESQIVRAFGPRSIPGSSMRTWTSRSLQSSSASHSWPRSPSRSFQPATPGQHQRA